MWTASVIGCVKNPDGETVTVTAQISDGLTTKSLGPWKLSASDPDTLKLSIIKLLRDSENFQSRRDATAATAASFDAATVIGKTSAAIQVDYETAHPPVPQTQDQLEAATFYQATQNVINTSNILLAASSSKIATKLTQKDLDDARVAWKNALSANPDKFLPLIPKDFPY